MYVTQLQKVADDCERMKLQVLLNKYFKLVSFLNYVTKL